MGKYTVHRLDGPHQAIRQALEAVGASVDPRCSLDLLVGWRGANYLLEVKGPHGKLLASQAKFLATWNGHAAVVRTVDEALEAIGARR